MDDLYDMSHADDAMRAMPGGKANTLQARMGTGGNQVPVLHECAICRVRRLTPLECERLQGLPDGWTDVPLGGVPASDAKRYKAIGNGLAQPCSDFVLRGIAELYTTEIPCFSEVSE